MDDRTNGRINDETDGWNDASRSPLLYVIGHVVDFSICFAIPVYLQARV